MVNRRDFLKGVGSAALATTIPTSFAILADSKKIELAIKPLKIQKAYDVRYMAELWEVSGHFGEIKNGVATMTDHLYFSALVEDKQAIKKYYDKNIMDMAMQGFDELLRKKYGNYKPVLLN